MSWRARRIASRWNGNDTTKRREPTTRPFANSPEASLPGCAGLLHATYFEAASSAKEAPKVDFGTEK